MVILHRFSFGHGSRHMVDIGYGIVPNLGRRHIHVTVEPYLSRYTVPVGSYILHFEGHF